MFAFKKIAALVLIFVFSTAATMAQARVPARPRASDPGSLPAKIRRFSPTVLTASTARLAPKDRLALRKIIAAAKLLDSLFLRQVWLGNEALKRKLEADRTPMGRMLLHYFLINDGPWSRLDEKQPFIDDIPAKLAGANHYPEDMTKEEFNTALVHGKPASEVEKAQGYFYAIRRDASGKLTVVPYSEEYREFLDPAAKLLREAAALTTNATLRDFLNKRAAAFASNDYYDSDVAWMDLDSPIDVTIGPYETYEDELFGYKAAFEAYVTLRDDAETEKLRKFSDYMQELENNLPIEPKYRNPKVGASSPLRVVNVVFSSGEGNSGVQTAAFNLPNDERVVKAKGSKRVMLKNTQDAKFNKVLLPISRVVLEPAQQRNVAFDSFFTHILMHEVVHGLGPHNITVNGQPTTPRLQLKEKYSSIEEAKADVTGLWALQYLIDKGVIDRGMQRTLYTTYLASMFRSVRFGITESHGRGVALQFNYFTDEGAIKFNERTGRFSIDESKIRGAVNKLANELLMIEALGSYEKATAILDKYANIRPPMKGALDKLKNVPVDIEPVYPLAR
ncbi:MAG: dipeptidyl-peptidase 3 family protein [Pyrinomonadaceae bacterium]